MIRLVVGAVVAAGLAWLILDQSDGAIELVFWEILLAVVIFMQFRRIPDPGDPLQEPLFRRNRKNPPRLPRGVAATELSVVDATTGYLSPDRRLRPALIKIAEHRLGRHGLSLSSPDATEKFEPSTWKILSEPGDEPIDIEVLESLVEELERL